jgi:hypothetical protein
MNQLLVEVALTKADTEDILTLPSAGRTSSRQRKISNKNTLRAARGNRPHKHPKPE